MGVPVQAGSTFRVGAPRRILDAKYVNRGPGRDYDVARDGRFLMIKGSPDDEDTRADRLVVVVDWREELKANLGPK